MTWLSEKLSEKKLLTTQEICDKFSFKDVMGSAIFSAEPIAGRICGASVVMHRDTKIDNIKPLDQYENIRELMEVRKEISRKCRIILGWASPVITISSGLQEACRYALLASYRIISLPPDISFVDGTSLEPMLLELTQLDMPIINERELDQFVECVMIAKVIAKLGFISSIRYHDDIYPEYNWKENLGFKTEEHIEAIITRGITPIHRNLSKVEELRNKNLFANIRNAR